MLIGFFLSLCGCLLYVLIKPPLEIRKVKSTSVDEKAFGDLLKYTSLKRSRSLVLPSGISQAQQSNLDREAKQNA
jgi:hypothetical protein